MRWLTEPRPNSLDRLALPFDRGVASTKTEESAFPNGERASRQAVT